MPDTDPLPSCASGGTLREHALHILRIDDPIEKASAARALGEQCARPPGAAAQLVVPDWPGRPSRPVLVSPRELKRRSMASESGRAALLHALAHIEFNAINLALDAMVRFAGLPDAFYTDWLKVAAEEGLHFSLLRERLAEMGVSYGAFPAHDGLWTMALATREDAMARMALVPRTLEARGLDASPPIRARLAQAGDLRAAAILDVILHDEIGHVAIGNYWYRWLAHRAGVDPVAHYAVLAAQYGAPRLKGPFNLDARRAAGFQEDELAVLCADHAEAPHAGTAERRHAS